MFPLGVGARTAFGSWSLGINPRGSPPMGDTPHIGEVATMFIAINFGGGRLQADAPDGSGKIAPRERWEKPSFLKNLRFDNGGKQWMR